MTKLKPKLKPEVNKHTEMDRKLAANRLALLASILDSSEQEENVTLECTTQILSKSDRTIIVTLDL